MAFWQNQSFCTSRPLPWVGCVSLFKFASNFFTKEIPFCQDEERLRLRTCAEGDTWCTGIYQMVATSCLCRQATSCMLSSQSSTSQSRLQWKPFNQCALLACFSFVPNTHQVPKNPDEKTGCLAWSCFSCPLFRWHNRSGCEQRRKFRFDIGRGKSQSNLHWPKCSRISWSVRVRLELRDFLASLLPSWRSWLKCTM